MTPEVAEQILNRLHQTNIADRPNFEKMYQDLFDGQTDQTAALIFDTELDEFALKDFDIDYQKGRAAVWIEEPPIEFSTGQWWMLGPVTKSTSENDRVIEHIEKMVEFYLEEAAQKED